MTLYCLALVLLSLGGQELLVESYEIPHYTLQNTASHNHISSYPLINQEHSSNPLCIVDNKLVECPSKNEGSDGGNKNYDASKDKTVHLHNLNRFNSLMPDVQPLLRRLLMTRPSASVTNMNQRLHPNNIMYPMQSPGLPNMPKFNRVANNNNPYFSTPMYGKPSSALNPPFSTISTFTHNLILKPTVAISVTEPTLPYQILSLYEKFKRSLNYFERKFYMTTFSKLTSISPQDRRVNGMSFVQSGLILQLTLMALALEVDSQTKAEISTCIGFRASELETITIIRELISSLPGSSGRLRFRRAARLMLWPGREVSLRFRTGAAAALGLNIERFNGTENPEQITKILNQKIEADSGGAIRDTFDEDDVSEGVTAVLTDTLYFRARWRAAPTVLNGTTIFHDADDAPKRAVKMIRLNDVMGYADIKEWNAQALEIPYAAPDCSIIIIVPRTPSLRRLAGYVASTSITNITARMTRLRVAATMPLYTLRMTLLLPNKLQTMGVSRLFDVNNLKAGDPLRLSHMVQRIMFWAEAGRHAYKDDGFNWDEPPDVQLFIDRPYIFFIRWRNLTLMNGNFVL